MGVATRSSTLAIGICFPVIGAILCATRILLRRRQKPGLGFDDYLAVFAWLVVTGACAALITGIYTGAFFLTDANDPAALDRQEHAIAQTIGSVVFFYFFASASIKWSILFFYQRIFVGKKFQITSRILFAATAIWLVYSCVVAILYCGTHVRDNFEGPWDDCPAWGFQIQLPIYILDTLIDFIILVMPIPLLLKLRIEITKKILLLVVFTMGGLAFVASLMNTIYQFLLLTNPESTAGIAGTPPSPTSNGQLLLLNWPVIEVGVGLIACNLPSLSMLATRILSHHLLQGWNSISNTVRRFSSPSRNSRNSSGQATPAAGASATTTRAESYKTLPNVAALETENSQRGKSNASSAETTFEMNNLEIRPDGSNV